jgi:hypothetical protein
MNSGFIQANTLGVKALGGDVSINVAVLIPSGSSLFVGGTTPYVFAPDVFGFNVIQAAAPTGLSGTIQITNPALNLSSSLSVLSGKFQATSALGRDRCRNGNGSSLAQGGRGGFAASARDLARAGDSDLLVGGPKAALAVDPGTLFLASLGMECPD